MPMRTKGFGLLGWPRPVPLTDDERHDYVRRDSVRQVVESKPYLDSIDRKNNKFKFNSILTSYTHSNSWKHRSGPFIHQSSRSHSIPWKDGMEHCARRSVRRKVETMPGSGSWKEISATDFPIRIGTRQFISTISYNTKSQSSIHVYGGSEVLQFNRNNPITPLTNALYLCSMPGRIT